MDEIDPGDIGPNPEFGPISFFGLRENLAVSELACGHASEIQQSHRIVGFHARDH
jgi:hypothetical protein